MHDAVPTQHELLLFHGGVPVALPAPTKSIRFLSLRYLTFKNGVVGTGNTVPRGMLLVERCFSDKPSLVSRHMGMPYASRFLNV